MSPGARKDLIQRASERVKCGVMLLLLTALARAHVPQVFTVAPGEDWCGVLNTQAAPGDHIDLLPGTHAGPCVVTAGGPDATEPTLIQAADPNDPPIIQLQGDASAILSVQGGYVGVYYVDFAPAPGAAAIAVEEGGQGVRIYACSFEGVAAGVRATAASTADVRVSASRFADLSGPAVEVRCAGCSADIAGNLVEGAAAGIVLAGGVAAAVADNVVYDTAGPALAVEGSGDEARVALLDRNLLISAAEDAALRIDGGPALARSNVVLGGAGGGVWASGAGVRLLGNTVVGEGGPALTLAGWGPGLGQELSGTALWQASGEGGLPAPVEGAYMAGNLECDASCWVNAEEWDFLPAEGSPLLSAGAPPEQEGALPDDFCAQPRGDLPQAGALERPEKPLGSYPLTVDFKACVPQAPEPADTGGHADDEPPFDYEDDDAPPPGYAPPGGPSLRCGCQGEGGAGVLSAWAALSLSLARRRKRS